MKETEMMPKQQVVSDLPAAVTTAFETGIVYATSGRQLPLDSNISQEEAQALYQAVMKLCPSACAEIGFAKGISTLAITQALNDLGQGHHHVIDPFQKNYEYAGVEMVRRAGLASRLTFYEAFAEDVVPRLPRIQFAFIDASHLFDLTLAEFVLLDKKLDINGIIGLHDMWMPSLQKVSRYILNNRDYKVVVSDTMPKPFVSVKRRLKNQLSNMVAKLHGSDRFLSPEFLAPWSAKKIPNMLLLRKTGDDRRDWREHNAF